MELFSWNVYVVNYWPGISECIPGHNSQIEGGAMQVTIHKLSVDVYPFFPAGKYITPRRSLSDIVTEINTESDSHSWQGIGWWEQIYAVNA